MAYQSEAPSSQVSKKAFSHVSPFATEPSARENICWTFGIIHTFISLSPVFWKVFTILINLRGRMWHGFSISASVITKSQKIATNKWAIGAWRSLEAHENISQFAKDCRSTQTQPWRRVVSQLCLRSSMTTSEPHSAFFSPVSPCSGFRSRVERHKRLHSLI